MVRVIGGFRLFKGLVLLAVGFGALQFLNPDEADLVRDWLRQWHVDPGNHYFRAAISRLGNLNSRNVVLMSCATFFYAGLFMTEGVGLLLRKRWAEMLTVIATGSFVPLEIYHLSKHFTALKGLVIIINIAIVIYLYRRLRRGK